MRARWRAKRYARSRPCNVIGTIEIAIGLAIASRPFAPTVSAVGSAAGAVTFLTTLSFLFTTPGALSPQNPANGFLMKDVVLLGACIATAAEALEAARARSARRAPPPISRMPVAGYV